ncbi:MAG: hypothetical protein FD161_3878 [Limisphaerales bacterium]|nr:MAG: hypothetical protein FD161_3878 [Limisphaerales bacterium]KAG0507388.1 MAG: hypothetical protein E1N63_3475 [Limisphaerales bacterium]TXT50728.1 MAG: hypothetical protein FD140_2200 [Limisphaerales bacterium]
MLKAAGKSRQCLDCGRFSAALGHPLPKTVREKSLASSPRLWLLAVTLQSSRPNRFSPVRFLVALAAVCALVTVGFLAVSPEAHACLHAHHNAPDHDCVVKHLADGKLLVPVLDTPLPDAVLGDALPPGSPVSLFVPPVPHRLPAGRAPPTV